MISFEDFEIEPVEPEPEEIPQKEPPKIEAYISQDGFVVAPVYRGFTEIREVYYDVISKGGIICGGYVRYMASPRSDPACAGDLDVFCPTEEIFEALKEVFRSRLVKRVETEVAITYNRGGRDCKYFPSPPIQLIKPIREGKIVANGTMEEILDNFDFTVIRCGLLGIKKALVDADFLHDEEKMILRLKNIHCPISSTLRCMKYAKKGYWMPPMHVLKLFFDWEGRDPEYRNKLAQFLASANEGRGLSKEDVDQLEAMMRID
jgi:hypothetical protein